MKQTPRDYDDTELDPPVVRKNKRNKSSLRTKFKKSLRREQDRYWRRIKPSNYRA